MARKLRSLLIVMALSFAGVSARSFEIVVDGASRGTVFEGIGALSAGASSRLLMDYPEPQRNEILDYLFKPGFGASLHHLKVEIGGDVNSTDGTEPSYARSRAEWERPGEAQFNRGYEWWLMREARKRNPDILLDILQWGAPYWIGERAVEGEGDAAGLSSSELQRRNARKFFSQDNADFVVGFIKGAKQYHGLEINYCGIWNETPCDTEWIKLLRRTLDTQGLNQVRIVAADQCGKKPWEIAKPMLADKALMDAVYAIGGHYPGMLNPPDNPTLRYNTIPEARQTGKPIWSSEDGPWKGDWEHGGRVLAMLINRNHVVGGMSKTIIWSLITSYYDCLPLPGSGPMRANTPWSGHYEVQPALWAIAHTTQFAQPGWRYLDNSCGLLPGGGSFVALRSPDTTHDFSVVIETMEAREAVPVTLRVRGGLASDVLHVWRSNGERQFDRLDDLPVQHGEATMTLQPECLYSLTTTDGQSKGLTSPPLSMGFPMPYSDDFDGYDAGRMPRYFSDQGGIFEIAAPGDRPGKVLRQHIAKKGIEWALHPTPEPFTVLGDAAWTNYNISVDVRIEQRGYAAIYGRIGKCPQSAAPPEGYCFKVHDDGTWQLCNGAMEIASGKIPFHADKWHTVAMQFAGTTISLRADGREVNTVQDATRATGYAGLGTGWNCAEFDNFAIGPAAPGASGTLRNSQSSSLPGSS